MSSLPSTTLWFLLLLAIAAGIGLLKKQRRQHVANDQLRRRHREINRQHLGDAYRDDGHALPQTLLGIIGGVVLFHLTVIALWFIAVTVMGMSEPKW